MKLCTIVHTLEITAICYNIDFDEIYKPFGVNSLSPEIMLV